MNDVSRPKTPLVMSYLGIRRSVGCLGVALPFILALGGMLLQGSGIRSSISSCYHTGMRDVFVGILWAIAVFLLSYKGYERKDDLAGDLACLFAVGIALFPAAPGLNPSPQEEIVGRAHLVLVALFLLTLAYFSLFLFTKTDQPDAMTRQKRQRNGVYRTCGCIMLISLALIALLAILPDSVAVPVESYHPLFWLDSLAIVAFGVSWFVKGEAILKDEA